jgi:hypothetical protein
MFDIFRVSTLRAKGSQNFLSKVIRVVAFVIPLVLISGCAHITIQPKDPQLISIEQFARDVTVHLMSVDPKNYEQYQHLLTVEITPGALRQLKQTGHCAKSPSEIKARVQAMNKANQASLVKIEAADFPGKATEAGLVPVEVKGTIVTISGDGKEKPPARFDLLYLVGTNKATHKYLIANVQVR